ncbi:MAG: nucleotidyl transferase AbiEii/AbiGii toxin family protein [Ottowia sp.]|nr:nucleotidyl transferase AbiEii/AbiGii toxin family protein [Ottowia sp.]
MNTRNLAASIRARLLAHAKEQGINFTLLLTRYAIERILYRLSISKHRDSFVLKGALLFDVWFAQSHRPTRDADLLGVGNTDTQYLQNLFAEVCTMECADGIVFDSASVRTSRIRKQMGYAGVRVTLTGELDRAQCRVQIDVGFGDSVFPEPEDVTFPTILADLPGLHLKAYTRYTVVAEKFCAMLQRGNLNSRMKDYYDILMLSRCADFDGAILQQAVQSTLARMGESLPDGIPEGLKEEFAANPVKIRQWDAFLKKSALDALPLREAVEQVRAFLLPMLDATSQQRPFRHDWRAGETWRAP